jgi:hypothetical protein
MRFHLYSVIGDALAGAGLFFLRRAQFSCNRPEARRAYRQVFREAEAVAEGEWGSQGDVPCLPPRIAHLLAIPPAEESPVRGYARRPRVSMGAR